MFSIGQPKVSMSFDFDRIADEFDATRSFDPRLIDAVAEAIRDLLGQGASVIDIGCGTGRFLLPLTRMGLSAVGIDISRKMLARAGEKGLEQLIQGDASPSASGRAS
ncbi:MAG: class I SAM-dependent methyltransferase [Thermoplasmata archaeon]